MTDKEEAEETTAQGNEWEVSKMVDNDDREDAIPRGNEWEVVSLTASAYAAAPGPRGDESIHEDKGTTVSENDEAETSLFMSRHFVFPPSEHENLPIEPENVEMARGDKEDENAAEMGKSKQKEEENWKIEGLNVPEEFPAISLVDEKGRRLSFHGSGFDEPAELHGLNVDDKEQDIYGTAKFDSLHSGIAVGGSAVYDENAIVSDVEPSDQGTDPCSMRSLSPESGKEEDDDAKLPCGAWWKRRVASLCTQATETSAFWSIFVAAAVMGLVLLGQRWQQERWQVLQQRWQLSIGDEKSGRILTRLKDVIVGGNRRGTYITAASAER